MELEDLFKGLLTALPVIISVIAACISFYYSRKSKKQAEIVSLNNYISEAAREFEKKGTPVNYIRVGSKNGE